MLQQHQKIGEITPSRMLWSRQGSRQRSRQSMRPSSRANSPSRRRVAKKNEIDYAADLDKAEAVLAHQVHLPSFLAGLSVEIVAVAVAADRGIVVLRNDEVKVEVGNVMA